MAGITLRELEGALTVAGLQSGGQLLAPLEQETALSWAGFVLLTLEAVGLPLHAEARPPRALSKVTQQCRRLLTATRMRYMSRSGY